MYSAPLADHPGINTSGRPLPASQYASRTPSLVVKWLICKSGNSDSLAGSPSSWLGKEKSLPRTSSAGAAVAWLREKTSANRTPRIWPSVVSIERLAFDLPISVASPRPDAPRHNCAWFCPPQRAGQSVRMLRWSSWAENRVAVHREKPANDAKYSAPKPSSLARISGVVSP